MRTLTKLGRQVICERLGIYDENSIFVSDVEAFVDRVELLSLSTPVLNWIDIYKKELAKFNTEEEYIEFLDTQEMKLYSIVSELIYNELDAREDDDYTDVLQTDFNYRFDIEHNILSMAIENKLEEIDLDNLEIDVKHEINIDSEALESDDITCLRVYSTTIVYSALKYLCIHYDFPDKFSNFVLKITNSEYLASLTDLNIYNIDYRMQKRLAKEIDIFLCSMVSFISPKYINPKALLGIDKYGLFFLTSPNIPVNTLDRIHSSIRNSGICGCEDLDLSICKFTIIENILCIRDNNGNTEVITEDDLDVINITRIIKGEEPSVYDGYFQIKGREARLLGDYT